MHVFADPRHKNLDQNILQSVIDVYCTSLPDQGEDKQRRLCLALENRLAPWLDAGQMNHLRRFGLNGAALQARLSRSLARLLALWHLPKDAFLAGEMPGKTVCRGWQISFSHSGDAVFCALAQTAYCNSLGIDAEAHQTGGHSQDRPVSWTLREAAFKATGLPLYNSSPFSDKINLSLASGLRLGRFIFNGQYCFWRLLVVRGHWLGIVGRFSGKIKINIHWVGTDFLWPVR